MKSLKARAIAAYFRSHDGNGELQQPSAPDLMTYKGLDYVVLSNRYGILAVYRIRTVNGEKVLKRLIRWPAAMVEGLVG